jgi:hypothetical protein
MGLSPWQLISISQSEKHCYQDNNGIGKWDSDENWVVTTGSVQQWVFLQNGANRRKLVKTRDTRLEHRTRSELSLLLRPWVRAQAKLFPITFSAKMALGLRKKCTGDSNRIVIVVGW